MFSRALYIDLTTTTSIAVLSARANVCSRQGIVRWEFWIRMDGMFFVATLGQ